jgi:hypothetical protein
VGGTAARRDAKRSARVDVSDCGGTVAQSTSACRRNAICEADEALHATDRLGATASDGRCGDCARIALAFSVRCRT